MNPTLTDSELARLADDNNCESLKLDQNIFTVFLMLSICFGMHLKVCAESLDMKLVRNICLFFSFADLEHLVLGSI